MSNAPFDVLVAAFRALNPEERSNLLHAARTWPAGKIACGSRAAIFFHDGYG